MAEAHVVAICVAVAALALAAAVLGVVGEATKSKAPPSSRSNTRLLATVSAAAFVVGAFRSQSGERRRREDGVETYYRCTVLVAGMFAGASSLAFLAAAVGIAS
uniref:Uncharacterized protein n=1 Tax=Oryza rufipogon TaxID=4529 RepID=A0A0E0RFH1_ORYRU